MIIESAFNGVTHNITTCTISRKWQYGVLMEDFKVSLFADVIQGQYPLRSYLKASGVGLASNRNLTSLPLRNPLRNPQDFVPKQCASQSVERTTIKITAMKRVRCDLFTYLIEFLLLLLQCTNLRSFFFQIQLHIVDLFKEIEKILFH